MVGMKPYSEDLRTRIVSAVEGGMSKSEAARLFGVSTSSVKRYCRLAANEESLAPRKGSGRPPKTNAAVARLLEEDVSRRPYAAVWERGRGDCDGQPLRPQRSKDTRAHRGGGMRAHIPAALLAGSQPHRGGILEGEGDLEEGPSPNPRTAHRHRGSGALSAVSPSDARGFFEHRGYRGATDQPF